MYAHTSKPRSFASHDSWHDVSSPPEYARTRRGFDGSGSRKEVLLKWPEVPDVLVDMARTAGDMRDVTAVLVRARRVRPRRLRSWERSMVYVCVCGGGKRAVLSELKRRQGRRGERVSRSVC